MLRQTKMIKYDSELCLPDEDFGYMPFHIERNGTSCTNFNHNEMTIRKLIDQVIT